MKKAVLSAISVIALMAGLSATLAIAHEPDEFSFSGEAVESCVVPGENWSVEWTIVNDPDANSFGIVDTSPEVDFAPLFDDSAPGEFIPAGESASATSEQAYSVNTVTLFVLHDVTTDPEDTSLDMWVQSPAIERPEDCEDTTGSITIVKEANGAGATDFDFVGDLGNFNLDNDESLTWSGLVPGSYSVLEVGAEGWHLVNIDCSGSDFSDTDITDSDVSIDLEAGDEAICVFENEADEAVSPTPVVTEEPTVVPTVEAPTPQIIVVESKPQIIVEAPRITPPSTGTGGLMGWGDQGGSNCWTVWYYNYALHRYVPVFYCW